MTISFDREKNRATDATSGMAVEFVRKDYPTELGEFWNLLWKGDIYPFRVRWENGFFQIEREHPDWSIEDQSKAAGAFNLKEYHIPEIYTPHSREFLDHIDIFVNLFAEVARNRLKESNIHIYFEPWGVDPKFYRQLQFPPLAVVAAQEKQEGNGL